MSGESAAHEDGLAPGTDAADIRDVVKILLHLTEDVPANTPLREGLRRTPLRFTSAWLQEWMSGYSKDPKDILKSFEDGAEKYDEMVIVANSPVWSKCEHHIADMFGLAHIAYIPNGKILGLSKIPRIVDVFARRLQVQERITKQIADALFSYLAPKGVGVVLELRHLCMESRGVHARGTVTTTSALRGCFMNDDVRAEFLHFVASRADKVI